MPIKTKKVLLKSLYSSNNSNRQFYVIEFSYLTEGAARDKIVSHFTFLWINYVSLNSEFLLVKKSRTHTFHGDSETTSSFVALKMYTKCKNERRQEKSKILQPENNLTFILLLLSIQLRVSKSRIKEDFFLSISYTIYTIYQRLK